MTNTPRHFRAAQSTYCPPRPRSGFTVICSQRLSCWQHAPPTPRDSPENTIPGMTKIDGLTKISSSTPSSNASTTPTSPPVALPQSKNMPPCCALATCGSQKEALTLTPASAPSTSSIKSTVTLMATGSSGKMSSNAPKILPTTLDVCSDCQSRQNSTDKSETRSVGYPSTTYFKPRMDTDGHRVDSPSTT